MSITNSLLRMTQYIPLVIALLVALPSPIGAQIDPRRAEPQTRAEPEPKQIKIFPLRYANVEELIVVTSQLFGAAGRGNNLQLAAEPRSNSLIASGPKEQLAELGALLERLDASSAEVRTEPGPMLQFRIVWLAGGDADLAERFGPLPPGMEKVADEIKKLGINHLQLVGQTVVKTLPDSPFTATARPRFLLDEQPAELQVQGKIQLTRGTPLLELRLDGSYLGEVKTADAAVALPTSLVDINTITMAPLGHSVVVGVTPTNIAGNSEAVSSIFVIQITMDQ
jgi:hypothetical protein